jgi:CRISPR/Cas system CMR-associated protein Cmr1 (group 7 of RAMP superfamily)
MGFCNLSKVDDNVTGSGRGPGFRRGFRRVSGFGGFGFKGRRNAGRQQFATNGLPEERAGIDMLKAQAESMQNDLEALKSRIRNLEKADD